MKKLISLKQINCKLRVFSVIAVIFCVFLGNVSAAQLINDGFSSSRRLESTYFNIYLSSGIDLQLLTEKISLPPSIRAIIKTPLAGVDEYSLSGQLDLIFLAICEIMDLRLQALNSNIKICRDREELSHVSETLFGRPYQVPGFYVAEIDTLYIDAESITLNILGHELSHAVQSHYFVVPPPQKIQEVLAGFVEFQLRKYTHSLPQGN